VRPAGPARVQQHGRGGPAGSRRLRGRRHRHHADLPAGRQIRKKLKRRGVETGITCVYSAEPPVAALPPDLDDRLCDRGRVRNRLPSQMSLPGIFGYALAAVVLDALATPQRPAL